MHAPATPISRSGTSTTVPRRAKRSRTCGVQLRIDRCVGRGEREHAAADLGRRVRLHAEHRRVRVGGAQLGLGGAREDRDDGLGGAGDLGGHGVELGRLVGEDHEVGALGHLAVGERLAAQLLRQRGGAARAGVAAQHGLAPAAGERRGHVARADEADLHGG